MSPTVCSVISISFRKDGSTEFLFLLILLPECRLLFVLLSVIFQKGRVHRVLVPVNTVIRMLMPVFTIISNFSEMMGPLRPVWQTRKHGYNTITSGDCCIQFPETDMEEKLTLSLLVVTFVIC